MRIEMSLERKAIILIDLHETYLHNLHTTAEHREQVLSQTGTLL